MCSGHYVAWSKGQKPPSKPPEPRVRTRRTDAERKAYAKAYRERTKKPPKNWVPPPPLQQRPLDLTSKFWRKVVIDPEGCWIWKQHQDKTGHVRVMQQGKRYMAHRVAYELAYGEIPEGLLVCHRCDNPPCVRPDHLFVGTYRDNMLDAASKGRLSSRSGAGVGK